MCSLHMTDMQTETRESTAINMTDSHTVTIESTALHMILAQYVCTYNRHEHMHMIHVQMYTFIYKK